MVCGIQKEQKSHSSTSALLTIIESAVLGSLM